MYCSNSQFKTLTQYNGCKYLNSDSDSLSSKFCPTCGMCSLRQVKSVYVIKSVLLRNDKCQTKHFFVHIRRIMMVDVELIYFLMIFT